MIGYVTLGTNDLPRAAAFYDTLLAEIGAKRLMEFPTGIAWGVTMQQCSLAIMKPFNGQPATVGNGVMAAIVVDSREKVDRVYKKAIELGAQDVYVLQVGRVERPLSVPEGPIEVARVSFEIARRHRFHREMARMPEGVRTWVLPSEPLPATTAWITSRKVSMPVSSPPSITTSEPMSRSDIAATASCNGESGVTVNRVPPLTRRMSLTFMRLSRAAVSPI